ncbi:sugar phosphate isomerase/epimerase [Chitinophaga pendula]|uniref:sugar phosphate isomerase/epimerase family protein n=1 Tax=Chitinophaga TaxID=79328 RepID=UPI000BAFBF3F|nr:MULTISPECIES: sugar phosphate isomerase/epimerase family protein [Chitinophaga]ASZ12696.1 xylose isomerase [Chitinophaga sp. MD30]UCJ09691.1 sugar phosphate isomerase/epimerase [Chitinophaga pendula]
MSSRRKFLLQAALGLTAPAIAPLAAAAATRTTVAPETALQVGMAGYTLARLNLEQAIALLQKVGIRQLSVKDIHLPLDSSPEKIQTTLAAFSAAGIKVYAVGVIYMKTEAAVDQAFEYAKKVGVPLIVGVPNPELLDYTEKKIKDYNIRLAIHNHGPEDKLYPGPKNVMDLIRHRDARMGICLDIGHAIRAGEDPAKAVLAYKERVFDLHIKDVTVAAKDGKPTEIGRGAIDFPALVKALNKIRYAGICSIEYEKDMQEPLAGIAESTGFFKGVIRALR